MADALYARLGGYDGIAAMTDDLLPRLQGDPRLGRFWQHRGTDGLRREKQLLIDYLCASTGGPMFYTGRDMKIAHQGMRIDSGDWEVFLGRVAASLGALGVPAEERAAVLGFIGGHKDAIIE